MFAQLWLPSRETAHPGYLHPQARGSHCCYYTPPQRRAHQALAPVRRLVLRHCGRLDWEVHSVLSQPQLSSLCRAAQAEGYLVRGLGPTHRLLGPFLSMIPEINYPCACGGFKQAASGTQELMRFWGGGLLAFLPVLTWVTPEIGGGGTRDSRLMTKSFKELWIPITSSGLLPCNHHYNHGGLVHVHLGASFSPAAGFPEYDIQSLHFFLSSSLPPSCVPFPPCLSCSWAGEVGKVYRVDIITAGPWRPLSILTTRTHLAIYPHSDSEQELRPV